MRLVAVSSEVVGAETETEGEGEKAVMALSLHVQRTIQSESVARPLPVAPPEWLVDSGATSHIISRGFLSSYHVSHKCGGLSCELRAANGELLWVVVKIMVPFWVPTIVRPLICRVPKKGP